MYKISIKGKCKPLIGKIMANGSKNAILPIIAASILSNSSITLHNVPDIIDVHLMSNLLTALGAKVKFKRNKNYKASHCLEINCNNNITNYVIPNKTANKLRASFLMLGPMLTRFGMIKTSFPGGCNIGRRPIDMHIAALEMMGAKIKINDENIVAMVNGRLKGKEITFKKISVGATENVIMAATLAKGVTTIKNAATEPEVLDLIKFLRKMGADINVHNNNLSKLIGAPNAKVNHKPHYEATSITKNYTSTPPIIIVKGVDVLNGCFHKIITDRIEAGTYALAATITGGKLMLEGVNLSDIICVTNELKAIGSTFEIHDKGIIISRNNDLIKPTNITTNPYPNFPSDMQPQLMSAMCIANGISVIKENIFKNRFAHANELKKLGANIRLENGKAIISGVKSLFGANNLYANDLRSAAALILASLVANGETVISDSHHLWRGYEAMCEKLNSCGANISIVSS